MKNLRSYPGKNKFTAERTERVPQERWTKLRETLAPEQWAMGVFKTGALHINLGGCGLTVLIDRLYWACFSCNSIWYNQMCVCIERSLTLSGLKTAKVTWRQLCIKSACAKVEKSLWLVCIHCASRSVSSGVGNISVVILQHICDSSGPHGGMSVVGFRDQYESFLARPHLFAHGYLPPSIIYHICLSSLHLSYLFYINTKPSMIGWHSVFEICRGFSNRKMKPSSQWHHY